MVRYKNRYITVEITPRTDEKKPLVLKASALYEAVQKKIKIMFGDFGIAAIRPGFNAKYCNNYTKIAMIRCRHGPHEFILQSIPEINDVGDRNVSVKILHVGATMKHCFAYIKKYQEKKLELMWSNLKNDNEKKQMIDIMMTLTPSMKELN